MLTPHLSEYVYVIGAKYIFLFPLQARLEIFKAETESRIMNYDDGYKYLNTIVPRKHIAKTMAFNV